MKRKKIVLIGGGTGTSNLIEGLNKYNCDFSVIFSVADNGGSTGVLREQLDILPVGDIRKCLIALSKGKKIWKDLLDYRFSKGFLSGHNLGNIILASFFTRYKDIEKAIKKAKEFFITQGQIIPISLNKTDLGCILQNNQEVMGETNIDQVIGFNGNLRIKKAFLQPKVKINPKAKEAILKADKLVIGPGDLYTTLIPILLVSGVKKVIRESKAEKIYICNLTTKFGQTNNFSVQDHVRVIEEYLGKDILDVVIYNTQKFPKQVLKYCRKQKEGFVKIDKKRFSQKIRYIGKPLLDSKVITKQKGDPLKRSLLRHNSKRLAELIL